MKPKINSRLFQGGLMETKINFRYNRTTNCGVTILDKCEATNFSLEVLFHMKLKFSLQEKGIRI